MSDQRYFSVDPQNEMLAGMCALWKLWMSKEKKLSRLATDIEIQIIYKLSFSYFTYSGIYRVLFSK